MFKDTGQAHLSAASRENLSNAINLVDFSTPNSTTNYLPKISLLSFDNKCADLLII